MHLNMLDKKFKCEQCPFSTSYKQNLMVHVERLHTKNTPKKPLDKNFKCENCQFSTAYKQNLKVHVAKCLTENRQMNASDKMFKCEHCPFSTAYKHNLKKHVANVHNKIKSNMGFAPPDRIDSEEEEEEIEEDQRSNHSETLAETDKNLSMFRLVQDMKEDVARGKTEVIELSKSNRLSYSDIASYTSNVDKGLNNLAVEVCGLEAKLRIVTKERDDLLEHVKNLRSEITTLSSKLLPTLLPLPLPNLSPGDIPEYKCEKCSYTTTEKHQMIVHTTDRRRLCAAGSRPKPNHDHNEINSDNPNCVTPNVKRPRLSSDDVEQNEHDDNFGNGDHKPEYACDQCPYSTAQKSHLKRHWEALHEKIKEYQCEGCDYTTSRKESLKRHIETVHMNMLDKQFECEYCPFSTSYKQNLKSHEAKCHTGAMHMNTLEKKFICEHCHFSTAYRQNLKMHVAKLHMRTMHINILDKKYKCRHCPFAAAYLRNLKTHAENVHNKIKSNEEEDGQLSSNVKAYSCEQCAYKTPRRANLKGHIKYVHDGIANMFACDHCDYMAERKDHMQRHLKLIHGIEDAEKLAFNLLKVGPPLSKANIFERKEFSTGKHDQAGGEQSPSQIKEVKQPLTDLNIDEEITSFILPATKSEGHSSAQGKEVDIPIQNDIVMKLNGKPVELLSVIDLQQELAKRDLPKHWTKTGKRQALVDRLKNYLQQNPHECDPEDQDRGPDVDEGINLSVGDDVMADDKVSEAKTMDETIDNFDEMHEVNQDVSESEYTTDDSEEGEASDKSEDKDEKSKTSIVVAKKSAPPAPDISEAETDM